MPVTLTGAWSRAGSCSRATWAVAFLFSLSSAEARVTNIQITLTGSAFSAATFGSVGAYRLIQGKIIGTVDPTNPSLTSRPAQVKTKQNYFNPCAFRNPLPGEMISDATHPVGSVNPDGVPVAFAALRPDRRT